MNGIIQLSSIDKIIVFIGILILIIAATFAIGYLINRLKGSRLKNKSIDFQIGSIQDNESLVQNLEVRDYRHLLIQAYDLIKDDIRSRIRQNGWKNKKNWDEYVSDAINQHDIILTRYLDDHYYSNSRVDRLELFEWNKYIC